MSQSIFCQGSRLCLAVRQKLLHRQSRRHLFLSKKILRAVREGVGVGGVVRELAVGVVEKNGRIPSRSLVINLGGNQVWYSWTIDYLWSSAD